MIDNKIETITWHAAKLEEVLAELGTKPRDGLTAAQAAALLAPHGPNQLPAPPRDSLLKRFLLQFHNVLIYVLLAAAIGTALLDKWIDTGVILGTVVALVRNLRESAGSSCRPHSPRPASPLHLHCADAVPLPNRAAPARGLVPHLRLRPFRRPPPQNRQRREHHSTHPLLRPSMTAGSP